MPTSHVIMQILDKLTLRAVVGHPVAEAQTHIVSTALSVGTAGIGAFSIYHRKVACKPHN